MLSRLGRWSFTRRWIVISMWAVALVGVNVLASTSGSGFEANPSSPDSESTRGFDTIDEYFGGIGSGFTGTIVFRADDGVDDPEVVAAMTELFDRADAIEGVTVSSPYDDVDPALVEAAAPMIEAAVAAGMDLEDLRPPSQIATEGDAAGKVAYATLSFDRNLDQTATADAGALLREQLPDIDGLTVELGGQALAEFEPPNSEMIGLAFAVLVLIFAFGSVMAMGVPIGVALSGVGIGIGLITLMSQFLSIPEFATTLGAMIGIGVGIDYALFIITRYRERLHDGHDNLNALVGAIDTAGRAVIFAGLTVVISLAGMLVVGLPFISGLGLSAATTVLVTMTASITLLPALLSLVGDRIEVTRVRGLVAAGLVSVALFGLGAGISPLLVAAPLAGVVLMAGAVVPFLKREVPRREPKPRRETLWYRWSRTVQRHPWVSLLVGVSILLFLAAPLPSLRLGFSDESNLGTETTTRRAYDLLVEGFGPGFNGPLIITAEAPTGSGGADIETLVGLVGALIETDGVVSVGPPIPDDPTSPRAALIQVIPAEGPQAEGTSDLVRTLRTDVIPRAIEGNSLEVNVTGMVAATDDFTDYLAGRLPLFFGVVLALSFLLLMAVFRSVLVPVKAVIMNMLSIAAAYGVVVAIFQWGWAKDVIGIAGGGPIEPFIPMMLFAIVFGLSMDYEVFLLSRIKEEYDRTGDAATSVADGLAATASVISAAAAIMVVVFGSFVFEDDRIIKLFGIGLAVAVFLDATLVRILLVPATMELLGDRNWWLPRWLDRILPNIEIEGRPEDEPIGSDDGDPDPLGRGDRDPEADPVPVG